MAKNDAARTYNVKKRVLHDGKHYGKGDTIVLAESAAKPLLDLGAIALPAEDPATEK